jgi:cell division protein FtsZ
MGWEYVEDAGLTDEVRKPRILVVGCGGGGCNSITRLNSIGNETAETVAINTDRPHLLKTRAHRRMLIGQGVTNGLGTGGDPMTGRLCAENAADEINHMLDGVDLTFITVGLGGGTGTGLAPLVAEMAQRKGSVVVTVATTPFKFEGRRNEVAIRGIRALKGVSDTVLLLDNNRLSEMVANLPLPQAFGVMDQLISEIIKGMTEAITQPSLINLDFADLRTIVKQGGISTVLYGENSDPEAVVREALDNPLLEVDCSGATGALVHISGGSNLTLKKANRVMQAIQEFLDEDANVIFGARVDENLQGNIRLMAVITGIADIADDYNGMEVAGDVRELLSKYST